MKSKMEYLVMELPSEYGFVNITARVEQVVRQSGVQEGMVLGNLTGAAQSGCW